MGLRQSPASGLTIGIMIAKVPEYIQSLIPYVAGKPIEETQREFKLKRVIKLASNENALGPSPKALHAIRHALPQLHRYPDASAFHLKNALARHLGVEPRNITCGNGSDEIIDLLVRTYCLAGDHIVTQKAAFQAYGLSAQVHGVKALYAPVDDQYRIDSMAALKMIREDSRVKMFFLANPNNPTGAYVRDADLRRFLLELRKIRGGSVIAVLDYAYWEFVTATDLSDPMELLHQFENVVILRTFSKIYGLAGSRVGYGIASPEIIGSLEKVRKPFNLNALGMLAAQAALGDTAFVKRTLKLNASGMRLWEKNLMDMGIPYIPSQGNFLLIDTQTGLGRPGVEVYSNCLRRGVIFRPVANYGLAHALRVSVGTDEENQIGIQALRAELPKAPLQSSRKKKSPRKRH